MNSKSLTLNFFQFVTLLAAYLTILFLHYFVKTEALPDIVFLVSIYFVLNFNWMYVVKWLLLFSFFLDVAFNYYFSIHGLSYLLTLLSMLYYRLPIQQMPIWQQTFTVSFFMLVHKLVLLFLLMLCYRIDLHFWFILPVIFCFILWPWLTLLLSWLRLKLNLYYP